VELFLNMPRNLLCFPVVLLSLSAVGQTPGPPSPPANPGVTSAISPDVSALQKIEDNWSNAVNMRDQYGLELVLSPLFVDVSATGDVSTRNQQLANLISNDDKSLHLEQQVVTVRMLGDIAVANGTYVLHHKVASGPAEEKGIFTHVFQRVHGGWLCINSQRTMLRAEATGKTKKPSTAEQPFHIPIFSKSAKTQ
jgi:ketosteroid isomerase-like protein